MQIMKQGKVFLVEAFYQCYLTKQFLAYSRLSKKTFKFLASGMSPGAPVLASCLAVSLFRSDEWVSVVRTRPSPLLYTDWLQYCRGA